MQLADETRLVNPYHGGVPVESPHREPPAIRISQLNTLSAHGTRMCHALIVEHAFDTRPVSHTTPLSDSPTIKAIPYDGTRETDG